MTEEKILESLIKNFPTETANKLPFPSAYKGRAEIKAIVLGADPTNIIDGVPKPLEMVFGLNQDKSPYWRSIGQNIDQLQSITMENIYVQNICRNYFTVETSSNKKWSKIARDYWVGFLKSELDQLFDPAIPVLMTTEFILHALLHDTKNKIEARDIYGRCFSFSKEGNLLSRELIAFYRNHKYSLQHWAKYKAFIDERISQ